jgi:hypothetical protein
VNVVKNVIYKTVADDDGYDDKTNADRPALSSKRATYGC